MYMYAFFLHRTARARERERKRKRKRKGKRTGKRQRQRRRRRKEKGKEKGEREGERRKEKDKKTGEREAERRKEKEKDKETEREGDYNGIQYYFYRPQKVLTLKAQILKTLKAQLTKLEAQVQSPTPLPLARQRGDALIVAADVSGNQAGVGSHRSHGGKHSKTDSCGGAQFKLITGIEQNGDLH